MKSPTALLALSLAVASTSLAQAPGSFADGGETLVSAMMVWRSFVYLPDNLLIHKIIKMFLGNEEKVYIIDKAEANDVQINGHPAWASRWYATKTALLHRFLYLR